jgi:hemin uptake protein HemP
MKALPPPPARPAPAPLDSRTLFGAAREVLIHHAGQVYRLRHTLNGKLILTK